MPFQRFNKPLRSFNKNPYQRKPFVKRFVRRKLRGTTDRPRLLVFRSLKHIYGQLVDDIAKKTITTVSTHSKDLREKLKNLPDKSQAAKIGGLAIAEKALSKNIKGVVFDRNGYVYYGRVKAFAEGAREGGLWLHSH